MTASILQPPCDGQVKLEAERQLGRDVGIQRVHVSLVRAFDTVFHEGKVRTVCGTNLKNDSFMGRTLFGDSYCLGRRPVQRVVMNGAASC